ncbi:MAG: hypothetical protein JSR34_06730 [Proteobacteria bacterium]|nr:hypothetical protein [Pseudomonadota bacterium]
MNSWHLNRFLGEALLLAVAVTMSMPVQAASTTQFTSPPQAGAGARTLVLPGYLLSPGDALMSLYVTIDCGYISSLQTIPELWDINMGFEMPSQQLFRATVRLGAAAAQGLGPWARSIRVVSTDNSCFKVKVQAVGREQEYHWGSDQLGWAK